jgi:hypothetical protein
MDMSGTLRRFALLAFCLTIGAVLAAPRAHAQVPAIPELPATPDLPQPLIEAIAQAEELIVPVLIQGSDAASPAANAGGFALRPGCSAVAFPLLLAVSAGGDLPFSPGAMLTPYFVTCGAASADGPADPVFAQVDGAAGAQLESGLQPVIDQVHDGVITPVRPSLNDACGALAIIGTAPNQVPPPFSRFDSYELLCGT